MTSLLTAFESRNGNLEAYLTTKIVKITKVILLYAFVVLVLLPKGNISTHII